MGMGGGGGGILPRKATNLIFVLVSFHLLRVCPPIELALFLFLFLFE